MTKKELIRILATFTVINIILTTTVYISAGGVNWLGYLVYLKKSHETKYKLDKPIEKYLEVEKVEIGLRSDGVVVWRDK